MRYKEFTQLKNFVDFKNQNIINLSNEKMIYEFYKIRYNSENPPFYHCNPLYNTLIKCNQFQFIVVELENDNVLIPYKIIQIMNTKQIRILDIPISINRNKENENLIVEHLLSLSFVRIVFKNTYKIENITYEPLVEYNDYYYNFGLPRHKFNSTFRSNRGINKLLNNRDFSISVVDSLLYWEIQDLRESWIKGMEENGSKVSKTNTLEFKKIINGSKYLNSSCKIFNIVIYYKNKPISIQTFLLDKTLNICYYLYINHLGRQQSKDIELDRTLKNIGDIQKYLAYTELQKLGVSYMYVGGCRPTEKRLLKHKEKTYDSKIQYFITK